MLELRFEEVLPRPKGLVVFQDTTGLYDAVSNTSGYGGPNPEREQVAIFALLGQLARGSYDFERTLPAAAHNPLGSAAATSSFAVGDNDDGVYQALFFAVTYPLAIPDAPEGTLRYDGTSLLKTVGGDEQVLNAGLLSITELREAQPLAITVSEALVPVLLLSGIERSIDASLHTFTGTHARSVLEREARELWLTGETAVASIKLLFRDGRLPEASQYLAATQRLLTGGLPLGPLAPTAINSWSHA